MKIILTGATGFIGKHLINDLLEENHELIIITRKSSTIELKNNVRWIVGDISDINSIETAFENVDILINLAAELRDESLFQKTNVDGVRNLVQLANKYKLKRVVHLSSVGVVGKQFSFNPISINENTLCQPKSKYEISKLESEQILFNELNSQVELIILRPTNVYGDFHPRNALLNLFQQIYARKTVYIRKSAIVNYVYVKDLTGVIVYFVQSTVKGKQIFNVGSSHLMIDFLNEIKSTTSKNAKIRFCPVFIFYLAKFVASIFAKSKVPVINAISNQVIYNDEKLKKLFTYKYELKNGIAATANYYKSQKSLND